MVTTRSGRTTTRATGPSATVVFFKAYVMPLLYMVVLLTLSLSCWMQWGFADADAVRAKLHAFDASLGTPFERGAGTYNDGLCAFPPTVEKVTGMMDMFFLSHSLGWFVGALILRNPFIAWFLSAADELSELTFQNVCPNFDECWWDQLFLDLFGANLSGCIIAYFVMTFVMRKKPLWYTSHLPKDGSLLRKASAVFFAPTCVVVVLSLRRTFALHRRLHCICSLLRALNLATAPPSLVRSSPRTAGTFLFSSRFVWSHLSALSR